MQCVRVHTDGRATPKGRRMSTSWRRRLLGTLVGAVSVTALASIAAPVANAAPACRAGFICLYQNTNYGGLYREYQAPSGANQAILYDLSKPPLNDFQNLASSMVNNTDRYVYLCRNNGCPAGTDAYLAKPNSVDSTFTNNSFNDRTSGVFIMPKGYRPPAGPAKVPAH